MKIKVKNNIKLKENEKWRVKLHSFYNILQVLYIELNIFTKIVGESEHTETIKKKLDLINFAFTDPQQTRTSMSEFNQFKSSIFTELDKAVDRAPQLDSKMTKHLDESLINFEKILSIVEIRIKEFLNLIATEDDWVELNVHVIKEDLKAILQTMAIRSKGKYGVTFEKEYQMNNDYYFILDYPPEDNNISLPVFLPDVIRDLCANAKKYSRPGSQIICKLAKTTQKISLKVRDQGRGIPEDEIDKVVEYGFRASNVKNIKTYGDGFGLTKAYLVTKQNNGNMWIDSELGKFTEISIEIPIPEK